MSGKATRTIKERIMAKIAVDAETGCWDWLGYCNPNGYPRIGVAPVVRYAHRVSYETFVGPIPDGLQIDHLCRNRRCVNPAHMEPVTHRVNTLRGNGAAALHARKTHCKHGHEFTPENTIIERGRYRRCRTCRDALGARQRERRAALS